MTTREIPLTQGTEANPLPDVRQRLNAVHQELQDLAALLRPFAKVDEAWNAWDDLLHEIDRADADTLDALWTIERQFEWPGKEQAT